MDEKQLTPAMRQYMQFKAKYPDCLLLFRMGDFYETFYDDAKTAAEALGITLTARGKGEKRAPLAGIPYHALTQYLQKLVKQGYKVAIVEQVEDPKKAKGLVKRDLVRIITPGTVIEEEFLDQHQQNYLLAISENKGYGIAYVDISTGKFFVTFIEEKEKTIQEIRKIAPAEILYPSVWDDQEHSLKEALQEYYLTPRPMHEFFFENTQELLNENFPHFQHKEHGLIEAAGALLFYLKATQKKVLTNLESPRFYKLQESMFLDPATIKNLELLKNVLYQEKKGSLYGALDETLTPMGSRLLQQWILHPLQDKDTINQRLNTVEVFVNDVLAREEIREHLKQIRDIERLVAKISYGNVNPKDVLALAASLAPLPKIEHLLKGLPMSNTLIPQLQGVTAANDLVQYIHKAIKEEPNTMLREGNIIKEGFNKELDELRALKANAKQYLLQLEENEREKTGIKTLRISYNKVFGYFIEVSRKQANKVPAHYIRKQTQVNTERYITEELKALEEKILTAEEKANELEYELFQEVLETIKTKIKTLQTIAEKIATLDVLVAFGKIAHERDYTKPIIENDFSLVLKESRHPVLELLEPNFIPNDCKLTKEERMMIITGPNMAGKSTYMRQVALIALMAHIGSYVPATFAKMGIIDRIFTRVGAYDDLTHGQSTFMVEMSELATILREATEDSLVILDEIGRGTSTFDGVALAWSAAEYLAKTIKAKTLFATHYHVLNALEKEIPTIKNFNIAVKEDKGKIIFLHKIVHGGTDKSYGIHVAALAGIPKEVIERAEAIQLKLEAEDRMKEKIIVEREIKQEKEKTTITLKTKKQKGLDEFF